MTDNRPAFERLGVTAEEFDRRIAQGWTFGKFQGQLRWIKPPQMYALETAIKLADQPAKPKRKKRSRGRRG